MEKIKFGRLYISKGTKTVVLCTRVPEGNKVVFEGVVLKQGRDIEDNMVGGYSTGWMKSAFNPFEGVLTLEQKEQS